MDRKKEKLRESAPTEAGSALVAVQEDGAVVPGPKALFLIKQYLQVRTDVAP